MKSNISRSNKKRLFAVLLYFRIKVVQLTDEMQRDEKKK